MKEFSVELEKRYYSEILIKAKKLRRSRTKSHRKI